MKPNYTTSYLLLTLAQLMLSNYINLGPYIVLSVMPALILCLPTKIGTNIAMAIAFASGLLIDLLSEGVLGLNILSLVPVAFLRKIITGFVFGEELHIRNETFSIKKYGAGKVFFATALAQGIFLLVYLFSDGSSTRPFLFFAERFLCSMAVGTLLSIAVVNVLITEDKK